MVQECWERQAERCLVCVCAPEEAAAMLQTGAQLNDKHRIGEVRQHSRREESVCFFGIRTSTQRVHEERLRLRRFYCWGRYQVQQQRRTGVGGLRYRICRCGRARRMKAMRCDDDSKNKRKGPRVPQKSTWENNPDLSEQHRCQQGAKTATSPNIISNTCLNNPALCHGCVNRERSELGLRPDAVC